MPYTLDNMLADITSRKSAGGIATAAAYLKSLADCFSGNGACPAELFKLAGADLWAKELADAVGRLTFSPLGDPDFMQKSIREGTDITSGAVLEYDCVLSSKNKDRDGDILEQKDGLNIDVDMPDLWQHMQVQPVGKHIKLLSQDEWTTKCRFALADIPLGRDAAVLVKMGALRKSHGFKPLEFEPVEIVKNAQGLSVANGWHVKKANCFEGSLVSIPANSNAKPYAFYQKEFDGVCSSFSRGLLKTDAVKHWAKSIFDKRPVQAPGVTLEAASAAVEKSICGCKGATDKSITPLATKDATEYTCSKCDTKFSVGLGDGMDLSKMQCPICGHAMGDKSAVAPLATKSLTLKAIDLETKGIEHQIPGSFEWITSKLDQQAARYLRDKNLLTEYGYASIYTTLPTAAIVCTSYDSGRKCYRVDWSLDGDQPKFTGEPVEVDVKPAVFEKAAGELHTKAAGFIAPLAPKSLKQLANELIARAILEHGDAGLKSLRDVAAESARAAKIIDSQLNPSPLAALGL